jgi:hypothetical protein
MFSFLKKLFGNKLSKPHRREKIQEARIQFNDSPEIEYKSYKHPDADVHKLMIQATGIRKGKGYPEAIDFLKNIAEVYIRERNTALVTCMNKLIPYMKRDESVNYNEAYQYLEDIIRRAPKKDPYFLNLHITMADLIKSKNIDQAISYLDKILDQQAKININHYNILIKRIDLYIEKEDFINTTNLLAAAKNLLHRNLDRYDYIKKERKWFRSCANLNYFQKGRSKKIEYLYNRFIEFVLDMIRVLDPIQIELFHNRKDLYYKKERGFEDTEKFNFALIELGIENKKEIIVKQLYGYAFEEIPRLLGITEKQLNYKQGQEETIEELREKKLFPRKPFRELPDIENYIRRFVEKHTKF